MDRSVLACFIVSLTIASQINAQTCDFKMSYMRRTGVKCSSRISLGKMPHIRCSAACALTQDNICHAFNQTEDMNCELCLACPNLNNSTTWSDTREVNVFEDSNFAAKLQKDLVVYVNMTLNANNSVTATGTVVTVFGSPRVYPGQIGSALLLNYNYSNGMDYLHLDTQAMDCTGVLNPYGSNTYPCEKGFTISFWLKLLADQPPSITFVYYSPALNILIKHLRIVYNFNNGSYEQYWRNTAPGVDVTMNQWHHFGLAFDGHVIPTKYIDGCKKAQHKLGERPFSLWDKVTTIGCWLHYRECAHMAVDEFRFWQEQKDQHFMWLLYNSN